MTINSSTRKDEIWTLKVSKTLDTKVRFEAEQRGMNLSEFVRHCVYLFFEAIDNYSTQNDNHNEEDE